MAAKRYSAEQIVNNASYRNCVRFEFGTAGRHFKKQNLIESGIAPQACFAEMILTRIPQSDL